MPATTHICDLTEAQVSMMDTILEGERLGYPLMLHMNAASVSKAIHTVAELMKLGLVEETEDPGGGSVPLMWHRLTEEGRRVQAEGNA